MTTREAILQLPDEALVPVGTVRPFLTAGAGESRRWVRAGQARVILGCKPSTLRQWARRWWDMQQRGVAPPVRVAKNTEADESHWLFDWEDLWRHRQALHGDQAVEIPADIEPGATADDVGDDEEDAIALWERRTTGHLAT